MEKMVRKNMQNPFWHCILCGNVDPPLQVNLILHADVYIY